MQNEILEINHFINNEYFNQKTSHSLSASDLKTIDAINPATGKIIHRLASGGKPEIDLAVNAAKSAFKIWSELTATERAQYMLKIADEIERRKDEFALAESRDQGKPVSLAKNMDIDRVILNFRFFAGAIGQEVATASTMDTNTFNYVHRRPIGVAGLISPWNLPLYLLSWKIAPAIATGNTVVCKPSELTSLTAHLFTKVLLDVGLPKGVINIVYGFGHTAGQSLVEHPDVPLISFTGGTVTGRKVASTAGQLIKKTSLELGGKNPTIVFADADYEEALNGIIRSSFLNQGEICLCGSRIYVQDEIYDSFVSDFVGKAKNLVVGDPESPRTFMGPLVSKTHLEKVLSFIEIARNEGGKIQCGGEGFVPKSTDSQADKFKDGNWLLPTVITDLRQDSKCIQEEIFGPVVTVSKFSTLDEVERLSNDTAYGLSASIWTSNLSNAHRLAQKLQVGTVWVNTWLKRDLRMPFGGSKMSGIGREGGQNSIEFFTEPTTICVKF